MGDPLPYDECLLVLISLASAPLTAATILPDLDDIDEADLTLDILVEEIGIFQRLCSRGLNCFKEILSQDTFPPDSDPEKYGVPPTGKVTDEKEKIHSIGIYLLGYFARRIAKVSNLMDRLATSCQRGQFGAFKPDVADELRRVNQMVQQGARPSALAVDDIIDVTQGLKWDLPDLHSVGGAPRVAFREEIQARPTEDLVKSTSYVRRQGRQATGYPRADLADIQAELDAIVEEGPDVSGEFIHKQRSSIDESQTVEIEDSYADPHWHDMKRKVSRELRVRRRIPTGHPKVLSKALLARTSIEEEDQQTTSNTQQNARL